jgi:hypothetical protein
MSNHPTAAPGPTGPWRLLILDRNPDDPKWLIATVTLAGDTRPAVLDVGGGYTGWMGAGNWVSERVGRPVELEGLHDALVWLIREGRHGHV